jgi:F420-non-reducing hydrogenase iron-sulfur subunit
VKHLRGLLDQIGLNGERAWMVNLSAAMGARFAEVATEFVDKIKELGPNPLGTNGNTVDSIQ